MKKYIFWKNEERSEKWFNQKQPRHHHREKKVHNRHACSRIHRICRLRRTSCRGSEFGRSYRGESSAWTAAETIPPTGVVVRVLKAKSDTKRRDEKMIWFFLQNYRTIFEMLTRTAVAIGCNKFFRWTQFSVNLSKIVVIEMWLKYANLPFFADCFKNVYPIHIDWIEPGEQSDSLVKFIPEENVKFILINWITLLKRV